MSSNIGLERDHNFGMPSQKYVLLPADAKCPDFHSCGLVKSMTECGELLDKGLATTCEYVTTFFANVVPDPSIRCGRSNRICGEMPGNDQYKGPDRVMYTYHHETRETVYTVYTIGTTIILVAVAVISIKYLASYAVRKLRAPTVEHLKKS